MKTTLLLYLTFFTVGFSAYSQTPEIQWSPEIDNGQYDVIAGNDQSIYAVSEFSRLPSYSDSICIRKFDASMNLVRSFTIGSDFLNSQYNYRYATNWTGEIVLIFTHPVEGSGPYTLSYLALDPNTLQPQGTFTDIAEIPETGEFSKKDMRHYDGGYDRNIVSRFFPAFATSPSGLFVLCVISTKTKGKDAMILLGPDKKLTALSTITHTIEKTTFIERDLKVTDNGVGMVYSRMSFWIGAYRNLRKLETAVHLLSAEEGGRRLSIPAKDKMLSVSLYHLSTNELYLAGLYSSLPGTPGDEAGIFLWKPESSEDPQLISFSEEEKNKLAPPDLRKKDAYLLLYMSQQISLGPDGQLYFSADMAESLPSKVYDQNGSIGNSNVTMGQLFACAFDPETNSIIWVKRFPRRIRHVDWHFITSLSFLYQGQLLMMYNDSKENLSLDENLQRPSSITWLSFSTTGKPAMIFNTFDKDGTISRSVCDFIGETRYTLQPLDCTFLPDGRLVLKAERTRKCVLGVINPE